MFTKRMTVMTPDLIFMPRLTSMVSRASTASSPIPMDAMAASIWAIRESTLMAVYPLMDAPAALTTCCPTSNTAIVISKVWFTR